MSTSSHASDAQKDSGCDHDHGHGPGHSHKHSHGVNPFAGPEERKKDRRRLIGALIITGFIAVAEAVGGYLTNYLGLMSDAGHMLTDVSGLALSLLALWFAGKPANVRKTYGYYRAEILSALVNGVLLVGITGVILFEAIQRFRQPSPIALGWATVISVVGLVCNLITLRLLHHSHSLNMRGAFLHVLGDTLSSVAVIAGAGIIAWTGWLFVDPLISVLISLVIVVSAVRLVRDAVDVLLEATPAHVDLRAVRDLMAKVPGVTAVHDLHVWTISSGIYALSAHLVVLDPMTCNNDQILTAVKHDLFDRFGIDHTTIQIESETFAHLGEVH
ncbi:MAG: cation diffusion facilitator family transporter [Myxococcaceae bacterium]